MTREKTIINIIKANDEENLNNCIESLKTSGLSADEALFQALSMREAAIVEFVTEFKLDEETLRIALNAPRGLNE